MKVINWLKAFGWLLMTPRRLRSGVVLFALAVLSQPMPTDDEVIAAIKSIPIHRVNTPTLVQWTCTSNTLIGAGSTKGGDDTISQLDFYLPNPVLQGNAVVVGVSAVDTASITVTDEGSNTYTRVASPTTDSGNNQLSIWYAVNVTAGARRITFTLATPTASPYMQGIACEFYNVATASPTDTSGAGQVIAAATTWTTGSFSTAVDGDLIVAFGMTSGSTPWVGTSWTAGSGFTLIASDIWDGFFCEYQVQSTHGAINPGITLSPSTRGIMVACALKSAAAGNAVTASACYVKGIQHTSMDAVTAPTYKVQMNYTGNCLVLCSETTTGSGGGTITGISDGGTNTFSKAIDLIMGGSANPVTSSIWYTANVSVPVASITITVDLSLGNSRTMLYDIVNAAAAPIGTTASATNQHNTSTYLTTVTITPGQINSAVIVICAVQLGTNYGVWGLRNYFDCATFPQADDGYFNGQHDCHLDRDNCNAHSYALDTSPISYTWSSSGCYQGGSDWWTCCAVEIKAATSSAATNFSPTLPTTGPVTLTGVSGMVYHGCYICPVDVASATVAAQGSGGCGGRGTSATGAAGKGGGKGGDCVMDGSVAVVEEARLIYRIGGGGTNAAGTVYSGCSTVFYDSNNNLTEAKSGTSVANNSNTSATTSSSGNNLISGNVGGTVFTSGTSVNGTASGGAGGSGSAGTTGNGGAGSVTTGGTGGSGSPAGVTGGNGKASGSNGAGGNASAPGGGGGGCFWVSGTQAAGLGGAGMLTLTPNYPSTAIDGTISATVKGRVQKSAPFYSGGGSV